MRKVERILRQIKELEREIEQIHGEDPELQEKIQEKLYKPRSVAQV